MNSISQNGRLCSRGTPRLGLLARSGLSIIEVMTSIVVAMIGVMGVMILVPFAVRQAQTGLDTEAAAVVARNAYSQFVIGGYRNYGNWLAWDNANSRHWPADDITVFAPQPYSIDPLGISETGNYIATTFPFNVVTSAPTPNYPNEYRIPVANLRLPAPGVVPMPMSRADARRMFRASDDLSFSASLESAVGAGDAALNGPTQLFDLLAGAPVRRQAAGRFSWSAIAVPNKTFAAPVTSVSNWKLYVLVYKDRDTDATSEDTTPINYATSPKMRAARVTLPTNYARPVNTIQIDNSADSRAINKDDWVMLINRMNPPTHGYDWQIGFYRVVNYQTGSNPFITLDGPDFNFDNTIYGDTYVVHLKNVVGVYERTIVPEGNSNWNLTF